MSPRLRQMLVAGLVAIILSGWWLYLRSPSVQVPRTFARIKQAIDEARSGLLLDQLHPDYSIKVCWPGLGGDLGLTPSDDQLRLFARQGIPMALHGHTNAPLALSSESHHIEAHDDRSIHPPATLRI